MTTNKADRPAISSYDEVTLNGDGSEDFYFGLTQPDDVKRGNWIETGPKKGWFTILRLYRPLEPFFTKKYEQIDVNRSACLFNVCSQYLIDFVDSKGDYFDGSKTYKVTLFPPKISAENNRCGRGEAIKK